MATVCQSAACRKQQGANQCQQPEGAAVFRIARAGQLRGSLVCCHCNRRDPLDISCCYWQLCIATAAAHVMQPEHGAASHCRLMPIQSDTKSMEDRLLLNSLLLLQLRHILLPSSAAPLSCLLTSGTQTSAGSAASQQQGAASYGIRNCSQTDMQSCKATA